MMRLVHEHPEAREHPGVHKIRRLCRWRRFAAAAAIDRTMRDADLLWGPSEWLADGIRGRDPELARRLYRIELRFFELEGTYATGSGDGLVAAMHMDRI